MYLKSLWEIIQKIRKRKKIYLISKKKRKYPNFFGEFNPLGKIGMGIFSS